MENITIEQLKKKVSSVYKLCNLAAMRAIELNSGMKKLVEADLHEKVTTTALREIAEGKVRIKKG